jgi:hypothetical protein
LKILYRIIRKYELNHFNIKGDVNRKKHQRGYSKGCSIYITGQKEKIYWPKCSQVVPAHPSGKGRPKAR